jgi:integrase
MSADGQPLRPDTLTRWCRRHFGKFHTLRHSHASALLNAGVSIKMVADRLGHARATTTSESYARPCRARIKRRLGKSTICFL